MRKLIVCNIMSLDGYYTGPGNNVMVLPLDEAFDAYNAERLRRSGQAAVLRFLSRTSMPIPLASISHPPKALTAARRSNCSFV